MAPEFLDTPHFAYHFIDKLFAFQKLFYNFSLNLGVCKFICVYEIPIYTGLNNVNLKINKRLYLHITMPHIFVVLPTETFYLHNQVQNSDYER